MPVHGHQEEAEHSLVFHQIGPPIAPGAGDGHLAQHLPDIVCSSCQDEKHG